MLSDSEWTIRPGNLRSPRRGTIRLAPLLLCGAFAATETLAGMGSLDPTFGDAGRVLVDVGPGLDQPDWLSHAILQSNGKILVVGRTDPGEQAMLLARFNADGTLDTSFGNGGYVVGTNPDEDGDAVLEQGDGRLLVVGTSGETVAVWRFTADGAADPAFGDGGLVRLALDESSWGRSILEQADGRIVVAVSAVAPDGTYRAELVRLHADGERDMTFGTDGALRLAIYQPVLLQQPDGRLIVIGHTDFSAVVFRASADGVLDETFGDGGRVRVIVGDSGEFVEHTSGTLQDDGGILVAGWVGEDWWFQSDGDGFLIRLDATGALDPEFGDGGKVVGIPAIRDDALRASAFRAVATTADGRIVVAQTISHTREPNHLNADIGIALFNPDGTIDATFGVDGSLIADFGRLDRSPYSYATGILQQADGKLVIVGSSAREARAFALARFGLEPSVHPGFLGLVWSVQAATEEEGVVELTVRRAGGSSGAVAISYATADISALAGSDYEPQSGVLEWADGDASDRIIEVPIVADDIEESEEEFLLTLSIPEGDALLATTIARVTVTDRDPEADSPPASLPPPPPVATPSYGGGSAGWLGVLLLALAACRRARRSAGVQERASPATEPAAVL